MPLFSNAFCIDIWTSRYCIMSIRVWDMIVFQHQIWHFGNRGRVRLAARSLRFLAPPNVSTAYTNRDGCPLYSFVTFYTPLWSASHIPRMIYRLPAITAIMRGYLPVLHPFLTDVWMSWSSSHISTAGIDFPPSPPPCYSFQNTFYTTYGHFRYSDTSATFGDCRNPTRYRRQVYVIWQYILTRCFSVRGLLAPSTTLKGISIKQWHPFPTFPTSLKRCIAFPWSPYPLLLSWWALGIAVAPYIPPRLYVVFLSPLSTFTHLLGNFQWEYLWILWNLEGSFLVDYQKLICIYSGKK